ncbi:hypothetical protein SMD44_07295 [Streptomyces alboflavus]|uniref:Histidine kinase/HSP90-like ATPase domain-containing protein n=1 Tax=Streptomyces alboflavus TaxID=67267 RepID=A0A1Z1WN19_9ACTN|nr:hypothetical protein SMD44_07295 [Streptomyces alboflavus]
MAVPAPAVDASVPQARHAVRDLLARQGVPAPDELVQGLLLIVSELVTNAVRHAALLSPMLAVEVASARSGCGSPWRTTTPTARRPLRPTTARPAAAGCSSYVRSPARRAARANVEHTAGGGKVIWAALPLKPGGI